MQERLDDLLIPPGNRLEALLAEEIERIQPLVGC
jgi:hypothetical protein